MDASPTFSATGRFSQIFDGLHELVWNWFRGDRASWPLMMLICHYVRRTQRRVRALVARIEAGTLRPPRPRTAPRAGPSTEAKQRSHNPFPRLYGWLCVLMPYRAAAFGYQLNLLLDDPAVRPMIEAEPGRFGRLLRPLCRMVGADPI